MTGTPSRASRAARAALVAVIASTALMTSASPASAAPCDLGTPVGDLCYTETGGNATVVDYTGLGGAVVIPATLDGLPVRAVDSYVFASAGLTSVSLPGSLTSIGDGAFQNNSLTGLAVPDLVTTIGSTAFINNNIATLTLGDSVGSIGTWAFANNSFTHLTIPASVDHIGDMAFRVFTLATVTMEGDEPPALANHVFGPVDVMNDPLVTFHAGATYTTVTPGYWVTPGAEYRVQEESTVTFSSTLGAEPSAATLVTLNDLDGIASGQLADPGALTEPGYDFMGWYDAPTGGSQAAFPLAITQDTTLFAQWLADPCDLGTPSGDFCYDDLGGTAEIVDYTGPGGSIVIPNSLEGLPVTSLGYAVFFEAGITAVTLPDSLVTIGAGAFLMEPLTTVTIPDSVIFIGESAFEANSLSSLVLGQSVATIDTYAFVENDLTHVTIPASVTTVGNRAFDTNPLATVTMEGNEPGTLGFFAFGQVPPGNDPLFTFHSWATYTSVTPGMWLVDVIEFRVQEVSTVTFHSAYSAVPAPVEMVTLNELEGITSGELADPGELTEAGWHFDGWYDAPAGNPVTFPLTITADTDLYADWTPLPCGVWIQSGDYCYSEAGGNATIRRYVGAGGDLTIPDTLGGQPVTAIANFAFLSDGLTSVTIPDTVVTIGAAAFQANDLTAVTVPDSVTTIGDSSFLGNNISSLTLGSGLTIIEGWAFDDNNLAHVTIPASVDTMGFLAFGNNSLTTVTMEGDAPAALSNSVFGVVGAGNDPLVTFRVGATYSSVAPGYWRAATTDYRVQEACTVTLSSTHGAAPSPVNVVVPGSLADPGPLTAVGYRFTGWYDAASGGDLLEFPLAVTADTTIYAHWASPAVTAPAAADPGNTITVDGTGFEPGESVTIELHSDPVLLATVVADGAGAVHATVTLPANTPAGAHTLVLTGSASGVTSRPIVLSGDLAVTGTNPAAPALVALALVGAGLSLKRHSWRRTP